MSALFHFLNVLLCEKYVSSITSESSFYFSSSPFFLFSPRQHAGTLWLGACGMDWGILKPQNVADGSHQWRDSASASRPFASPLISAPRDSLAKRSGPGFVRLWRKLVEERFFGFTSKTQRGQLDLWQGLSKLFLQVVSGTGGPSSGLLPPCPARPLVVSFCLLAGFQAPLVYS